MPEGEAIEHRMVTRSIENAQRKVEARNFDIRKQLLEYDDVANDQRKSPSTSSATSCSRRRTSRRRIRRHARGRGRRHCSASTCPPEQRRGAVGHRRPGEALAAVAARCSCRSSNGSRTSESLDEEAAAPSASSRRRTRPTDAEAAHAGPESRAPLRART